MTGEEETEKRKSLFALSRDCPDCGGHGLTTRYADVETPAGTVYMPVSCICAWPAQYGQPCTAGTYYRAARMEDKNADLRRLIDLLRHPELQDLTLKFPPSWRAMFTESDAMLENWPLKNASASWRRLKAKIHASREGATNGQRGVQASAEAAGTGDQGSGQGNDAGGPPVDCAGFQAA